jgi:YggT family protein
LHEPPQNSLLVNIGWLVWVVIQAYIWVIVISAVISWFYPSRDTPFARLLDRLTAPGLNLVRRAASLTLGGLDFTPLLLILALYFVGGVIRLSCLNIGYGADAAVILPVMVICLVQMVKSLCWLFFILMAARAVMSLVQPSPYNFLVLIVYGATEPLLSPLKGLVPRGPWGLDLKAVLFLAFLLLFDVLVLNNLRDASIAWGLKFGLRSLA